MSTLRIIYRFNASTSAPGVQVLNSLSARQLLNNFISVFATNSLTIIAENATQSDIDWISSNITTDVIKTNYGDAWQTSTFLLAISLCQTLPDDQIVYIADGSFLHLATARDVMMRGLNIATYVTGYDDPSKYVNTGMISNTGVVGAAAVWNGSEATRVYCDGISHYKKTSETPLCVMSLAKTFKHDLSVFQKLSMIPNYNLSNLWHELSSSGHEVICTIPAVSTIAIISLLAPVIDWVGVIHM